MPEEVKQAAALWLFTLPQVMRYRDLGLVQPMLKLGLDPQMAYTEVLNWVVNTFAEEDGMTGNEQIDDLRQVLLIESLLDNVDWNLLNTGASLLALTSQEAQKLLTAEGVDLSDAFFRFEAPTAAGDDPAVRRAAVTLTRRETTCSLIDSAGTDTYFNCAGTGDFAHPVSVCLDLAGNDNYYNGDDNMPAFGAGIFGYGLLLDLQGDDHYNTTYAGLGCGIFGTGAVFDQDGNDRYEAYGNSEGSAAFGAGLLLDLAGDDYYGVYKYGQGYGYTRGAGLLIDVAGNDTYYANLEDHFNGGLYGANHHVHFCQGSAFGRRADFTDGHSWAGGFGLMLDGAGDDKYSGDCYVQGNSYWYALGMCVDKGGNDVYHCGQYSQASAPHFSIGVLQDDGGDDRYIVGIRQSMGHGRDWSIAWFEDAAGNDWYQGARTTLGTSHINSLSFFWDRHGDDVYLGKGPTFGESEVETSGSVRDWLLTLGLFIDGGGKDQYYMLPGDESYEASNTFVGEVTDLSALTPLDFAGDGKLWVKTPPTEAAPGFNGVGLDAE